MVVDHHGGLTNGCIFSILVFAYSGKQRARYSKFEMTFSLLDLVARSTQNATGFVSGRVCILVNVLSTLLCNLTCAGGRAVSTSNAGVDVILKHPIIAFIAIRCAEDSCGSESILPYF